MIRSESTLYLDTVLRNASQSLPSHTPHIRTPRLASSTEAELTSNGRRQHAHAVSIIMPLAGSTKTLMLALSYSTTVPTHHLLSCSLIPLRHTLCKHSVFSCQAPQKAQQSFLPYNKIIAGPLFEQHIVRGSCDSRVGTVHHSLSCCVGAPNPIESFCRRQ